MVTTVVDDGVGDSSFAGHNDRAADDESDLAGDEVTLDLATFTRAALQIGTSSNGVLVIPRDST